MKREHIGRHIALAFVFALGLYFATFYAIEHVRTRKGGWQVTFTTDSAGEPSLLVAQPELGIRNVRFTFPGQHLSRSNLTERIVFDLPITNVPFGKVIYLDTTFLPGSVVFGLFSHEIQLLPRVLLVDRGEMPWQSDLVLPLEERRPKRSPDHEPAAPPSRRP
jgi:hypothetical protein